MQPPQLGKFHFVAENRENNFLLCQPPPRAGHKLPQLLQLGGGEKEVKLTLNLLTASFLP